MTRKFSIVVLTLNEEANLPKCLTSAASCDDVLVVDSGSTDRTVEIAKNMGARVIENRFENFAQQRNFANQKGDLRNSWVFHLDADETLSPQLFQECSETELSDELDGAWVAPRMMWRGNWLKRCTDYPAWQARFVQRLRFRFIEVGHGQREAPEMRMTKFQTSYHHDMSSGGVADWLAKHQRYAEAEAAAYFATPRPPVQQLWSSEHLARRRALKYFSYGMPCRPLLRFFYQYLYRGGLLDGRGAWEYCRLLARYEGFASEAIRSQRNTRNA